MNPTTPAPAAPATSAAAPAKESAKVAPTPASTPAPAAKAPAAPVTKDAGSSKGGALTKPGSVTPAAEPAPAAAAEKPKPAAPEKRKYKLKVDGAEEEREYTDEQIVVELQKATAAGKRMQEAAEVRKQWAQLKEIAKQDPTILLKELAGIENPLEWAEQQVTEKVKLELMPEQDRKYLEMERRAQAAEDRAKKYEEAKAQEVEAKRSKELEDKLEADFKRAFEVSELPWEPEYVDMFGKIALEAIDYGINITPEQMAAEVKSRLSAKDKSTEDKFKAKVFAMKGNDLLSFLGDDVVKEVLQAAVAKHKASQAQDTSPSVALVPAEEAPEKPKYRTPADWKRVGR